VTGTARAVGAQCSVRFAGCVIWRLLLAAGAWTAASLPAHAEVVRAQIASRTDVQGGASFGEAGAYELLEGRIFFEIDPANPRNAVIDDLDRAPRNAEGKVEVAADLAILRPKDAARGNGTLLLDVVNRGARMAPGSFDRATRTDPGDGFLMRHGFTVGWVGWQIDVPPRPGALRIDVPVAAGITGRVRASQTARESVPTLQFADLAGYPPAAAARATLTVRDGLHGRPRRIERSRFTLERSTVTLAGGFEPGRTYTLEYDATDPPIAGLGFAAVRDTAAWLLHAADAPARVRRAIAFGSSQSGRFLRSFLYLGFNADERGRQVFDGVIAHIAGASQLDLNRRWATPMSLGQFDATPFPFADVALRDPRTGVRDGLLDNPRARGVVPRVFYTNTAVEYWGGARSAALIHTTPDGRHDLQLPDDVRTYFLTGAQHVPARFPPAAPGSGVQRDNPLDYWPAMRALLLAMDDWVRSGRAPPPSRYPRLADGTLVPAADVAFPAVPGLRSPRTLRPGVRAANALLARGGGAGARLPYLVPQTDRDGIELAGVRLPELEVPLATYTGWNFRRPGTGPVDELAPLIGSYVPFPATMAERVAAQDPRAAIAERHGSRQAYLDRVREAAGRLVAERTLLAEDLPAVLERAAAHWDALAAPRSAHQLPRRGSQQHARVQVVEAQQGAMLPAWLSRPALLDR
jgi:hypothetical protein